jgi:hypothetical protein
MPSEFYVSSKTLKSFTMFTSRIEDRLRTDYYKGCELTHIAARCNQCEQDCR